MKYMIMLYGSQQDYDAMAGKATDKPAWSAEVCRSAIRIGGGLVPSRQSGSSPLKVPPEFSMWASPQASHRRFDDRRPQRRTGLHVVGHRDVAARQRGLHFGDSLAGFQATHSTAGDVRSCVEMVVVRRCYRNRHRDDRARDWG